MLEFQGSLVPVVRCRLVNIPPQSWNRLRQNRMDWVLFCDGGSQHHRNAYPGCRTAVLIVCVVIPDDRRNVTFAIRSDDARQKFVAYHERRESGVVVGLLFEGLQGECVRGAHKTTSVCRCRVNAWSVKGEMLLGHARVRGGVGAPDPVVRRTRRRCLWGRVSGERITQGRDIHSMMNMVRREPSLLSEVS